MIPDYVRQIQEIERQFGSQAAVTAEKWSDDVAKRFYYKFVDRYSKDMHSYLTGEGITGKGLDDLLRFVEQKANEMTALSGITPIAGFPGESRPIMDPYGNRIPWSKYQDGNPPGELSDREIEDLMHERDKHF